MKLILQYSTKLIGNLLEPDYVVDSKNKEEWIDILQKLQFFEDMVDLLLPEIKKDSLSQYSFTLNTNQRHKFDIYAEKIRKIQSERDILIIGERKNNATA
jgi:ACT domain-containing protein